jgi:membrane protease YdiL (CAAX protease family)
VKCTFKGFQDREELKLNKSIRNIVIFGGVTLGCGFLGNAVNSVYQPQDPMQSPGVLIWLVSPLAANLLLRSLGGDGWKDFGITPNLKSGWPWYLAALLIVPAVSLALIGLSVLFGAATLTGLSSPGMRAFLSLVAVGFAGNAIKNLFEEFAWRGYLTPRLAALNLNPFLISIITGGIWASWHIPYYLYFLSPALRQAQTSMNVPILILAAFFGLVLQAFAYGELRLLGKSVWPTWLMHNIANAVSFALVTGGFVILSKGFLPIFLSPGTEGIVYSLLMGMIGWGLYQHRVRSTKVEGKMGSGLRRPSPIDTLQP